MIYSKSEAKEQGIKHSELCQFHMKHPDQEGSNSCGKCILIRDECGCDEDMACEECSPAEFSSSNGSQGVKHV